MQPSNVNPPKGPKLTLVQSDHREFDDSAGAQQYGPVSALPSSDQVNRLRIIEALLFQTSEPMSEAQFGEYLDAGADVPALLEELQEFYSHRGVNLVRIAGKWAMRTASDLSYLLERHAVAERRLSKAALETLAIIAYHQPVTRAEVEDVRGVSTSAGTLDILLETGWVRPRGRRRAPGRPVTYGTTERFLEQFNLESIKDLPGLSELKGAGLLDATLPTGFSMPEPKDLAALMPDEMPLDAVDEADDEQRELDLPVREEDPAEGDEPDTGPAKD